LLNILFYALVLIKEAGGVDSITWMWVTSISGVLRWHSALATLISPFLISSSVWLGFQFHVLLFPFG